MKNRILNVGVATLFVIIGAFSFAQASSFENSKVVAQNKCAAGKCAVGKCAGGKTSDVNGTKKEVTTVKVEEKKGKCAAGKCAVGKCGGQK